jgi:pimeloyl-ACP methyl ester carboxylesterase
MTSENILLIHGTWGSGGALGELVAGLEARGFTVHSPSLRHHGTPQEIDVWTSAQRVAKTGLLDYVADLVALVETMDSPPIIAGHSLGGLLAQLVAARVPNKGLILFGTAPAWGMFNIDPMPALIWTRYLPQWLAGRPMYPCSTKVWDRWVCNELPSDLAAEWYGSLCAESGTAYREMVLWFADPKRAAKVDYAAITTPVLVIAGSKDNVTVPRVNRRTAAKYGDRGTYVELAGSDHMMTAGPFLPQTLAAIDAWLAQTGLTPA